ncbi:MAG: UDP-N-acetylmuramoyl-tripeptide--D-alanyl-D-alanine ligase, partial [Solirubrobacterales bacterium]|nr:UDP-N-acetylmuramoyl-tripeptide--D-alanyl-D-alanine ligase [Solirubrobacterales bacterium]
GAVLVAQDPLAALQRLATAWRRELGAQVIGVTGSTGKTSTKDLLAGLLAGERRTVKSAANRNTEIGLPLELLGAPEGTELLVLEMAMRGVGQIAELAAIAEPDVGVIVNVGPVHLELLGTIEAVASAKAELLAGLPPGGTAVVPANEPLLEPHRRDDVTWVTFGDGGEVELEAYELNRAIVRAGEERFVLDIDLPQRHQLENLLAAVAAARAVGVHPAGHVRFEASAHRGERVEAADGVLVIDDCYNANPMSVRAGLEDLSLTARARGGRAVAVLGDMLELGPGEREAHEEAGRQAAAAEVDVLVTVGPRAAAMADPFGGEAYPVASAAEAAALLPEVLQPGDTLLVKGSRGVGLEVVVEALA